MFTALFYEQNVGTAVFCMIRCSFSINYVRWVLVCLFIVATCGVEVKVSILQHTPLTVLKLTL